MPKFLTIEDIAQILNVSTRTIRRKIECNEIPYYRVGGLIRVDADDFENYLNSIKKEIKQNDSE